jgi:hypothetical protein
VTENLLDLSRIRQGKIELERRTRARGDRRGRDRVGAPADPSFLTTASALTSGTTDRAKALAAGFNLPILKPADRHKLVKIMELAERERAVTANARSPRTRGHRERPRQQPRREQGGHVVALYDMSEDLLRGRACTNGLSWVAAGPCRCRAKVARWKRIRRPDDRDGGSGEKKCRSRDPFSAGRDYRGDC